MATSSRPMKVNETLVHENLFQNLQLLTHFYPPNKDFEDVLKKDMFVKTNTAAFQQITYYLFNVLDSEMTKERIISWPVYDSKLERQFRVEVISVIDYINEKYDYADIPKVMVSQLVTPCGYKFAALMLKITMFVMYEHLKKNWAGQEQLIEPISPHNDPEITEAIIERIITRTDIVEARNEQIYENFTIKTLELLQEAERYVEEKTQTDQKLAEINKIIKEKQEKISFELIIAEAEKQMKHMQEKMPFLQDIIDNCQKGNESLLFLLSGGAVLEFNKEFVFPESVKDLVCTEKGLNLQQLFNGLKVLLQTEDFDLPVCRKEKLDTMINYVSGLTEEYERRSDCCSQFMNDLHELAEGFESPSLSSSSSSSID